MTRPGRHPSARRARNRNGGREEPEEGKGNRPRGTLCTVPTPALIDRTLPAQRSTNKTVRSRYSVWADAQKRGSARHRRAKAQAIDNLPRLHPVSVTKSRRQTSLHSTPLSSAATRKANKKPGGLELRCPMHHDGMRPEHRCVRLHTKTHDATHKSQDFMK